MLEDLQTEVVTEGKAEAKTYDKFACFCKDMTDEKTDAIKSGTEEKADLEGHIDDLIGDRDDLDKDIAESQTEIKGLEEKMAEASDERAKTQKVYDANAEDMKGAIAALKA